MYVLSILSFIDDGSIKAYAVLTLQMNISYFGCKILNLKKCKHPLFKMQVGGFVEILAFPRCSLFSHTTLPPHKLPRKISPLVLVWLIPVHLLKLSLAITFSRHPSLIFFCLIQPVDFGYSSCVLLSVIRHYHPILHSWLSLSVLPENTKFIF